MIVTATQSVNTTVGMILRVYVLTGATLAATPATGTAALYNCSITTTVTNSKVYGVINADNGTNANTMEANSTLVDDFNDSTHGNFYETFSQALTGTPGATTVGSSTAFNSWQGCVAIEILPNGAVKEHSSGPALVTTATLTALSTAVFNPPPGSVLVALTCTNGTATGAITMTISDDRKLTWTEQVKRNAVLSSTFLYEGIWTARVPESPVGVFQAMAESSLNIG